MHPADGVGSTQARVTRHRGYVVGDDNAVKVDFDQFLHHSVHVEVAIVDIGLNKVGQGLIDIAEMDFVDFALAAKFLNRFEDAFAHQGATLEPAADAEANANVGAVGNVEGALIAVVVAEDAAGDTREFGLRGIVGVEADFNPGFFGNRHNFLDKTLIVRPNFFFGITTTVAEWFGVVGAIPVAARRFAEVEGAGAGSAAGLFTFAAPNAVCHVGIGGIGDTRLAQVAQVLLVLGDFGIAVWQVEGNSVHVVYRAIAKTVDGEAVVSKEFATACVIFIG